MGEHDLMESYQAIWADDYWKRDDALNQILVEINDELSRLKIDVTWKQCLTAEAASTEMQDTKRDYRLAVIDAKYENGVTDADATYDWRNCRRASKARGIPYIIYTGYLNDVKTTMKMEGDRKDPLCIGLFSKDADGTKRFIKRVCDFFCAPPVRLLHLTDLHFGVSLPEKQKEDAEKMWDSLINKLAKTHDKTPFDAIAVTGDFAYTDPANDLTEILPKIVTLVKNTIGTENIDKLMIVPGNHDIHWEDFEGNKLSPKPWSPFLHFMHAIYTKRLEVMESTPAWSITDSMPKYDSTSDSLVWHRTINNTPFDVIGLCTIGMAEDKKGLGVLTEPQINIIEKKWESEPVPGTIRIGMMHHNIMSVLSRSELEEDRIVEKAGGAIHALMSYNCDVVLSGHAHTTNSVKLSSSQLSQSGNECIGDLMIVSTGTTGGHHDSRMRHRTCSILDFSDAGNKEHKRTLSITSLVYEDYSKKWVEPPKASVFKI